ncbi:caspase-1-like [Xylocopa sonorina]|uniref:caspase-1-like n=1 Tax=Xylocopa sonorina TaxID=1818115 RepID=UPI00403A91F6
MYSNSLSVIKKPCTLFGPRYHLETKFVAHRDNDNDKLSMCMSRMKLSLSDARRTRKGEHGGKKIVLVLLFRFISFVTVICVASNLLGIMESCQHYSQANKPTMSDEVDVKVFMESSEGSKTNSSTNSNTTDAVATHFTAARNTLISQNKIAEFVTPRDWPKYEMKQKRRGICLILNQMHFAEHDDRLASEVDEDTIKTTFSQLGFEVVIKRDLTFSEIAKAMRELSEDDYSDCDCISIFVLSHGQDNGRIYAKDIPYPLITFFSSLTNCISLAGKPKLFFIQACRGSAKDSGIMGRYIGVDAGDDICYTIPAFADFLFSYSCMEGYYSFNDPNKGSWYIQTLCETIDELWKETDLLKILVIVGRKVALNYTSKHNEEGKNNSKQIPCVCSTLLRDLYFTPK